MQGFEVSAAYWWLIIGVVCIAAEAFGIPGIGFLFAGLSAALVAVLIHVDVLASDSLMLQVAVFLVLTFLFALILWTPLKNWRTTSSSGQGFNNMVGTTAVVDSGGLQAGTQGRVRWSGTSMFAALSVESDVSDLPMGAVVEIVEVKGNVLIVKPHKHV